MYHIAVLTKSETQEIFYTKQLSRFCAERGVFPRVDCYRGQEVFFEVNAHKCTDKRRDRPSGRGRAECGGAPAGAFPGNAHHLVQRAGFFPACVSAARGLLSAGADNGRSVPARALCMGREKTTVCFVPSGLQPTWQGGSLMKKRNPIYSVGSFLLAGALTLSMAACSAAQTQATAEAAQTPSATATPAATAAPAEETTPSAPVYRRTSREGLAAQAGRGKPLHGKERCEHPSRRL